MMESTNSVCQYSSYLELVHDQIIQCRCTVFYLSSLFLARFLRAERVFLLASQQRSIYGTVAKSAVWRVSRSPGHVTCLLQRSLTLLRNEVTVTCMFGEGVRIHSFLRTSLYC